MGRRSRPRRFIGTGHGAAARGRRHGAEEATAVRFRLRCVRHRRGRSSNSVPDGLARRKAARPRRGTRSGGRGRAAPAPSEASWTCGARPCRDRPRPSRAFFRDQWSLGLSVVAAAQIRRVDEIRRGHVHDTLQNALNASKSPPGKVWYVPILIPGGEALGHGCAPTPPSARRMEEVAS